MKTEILILEKGFILKLLVPMAKLAPIVMESSSCPVVRDSWTWNG
ncbi:hypothetical protein [Flavobacterium soli]|nr:hypothetical protein [Flavobacterium soli]